MYSLNFDDFEKLIDAIKINTPEDAWWDGYSSSLLLQLNDIRNKALSIAWFQGEVPLINLNDKIAEQIHNLKVYHAQG
ncbi:hypothetical protein CkP1_0015 [Citrobacter phage CkP1]|nr:hypothetical protein CkP1_0015 [Citrobacter phage CkP1]